MAFAFVQQTAVGGGASSANFTNPVGTGNLVCVTILWLSTSVGSVTVTDDKSNVYVLGDSVVGSGDTVMSFYCLNATGGPKNISESTNSSYQFVADEFSSGLTLALDGHHGNQQASPPTSTDGGTSGSITTTANGDLVWGTQWCTGSRAVGTGFTATSVGLYFTNEYLIQSTAGAIAATFTNTGGAAAWSAVLAFKAASSLTAISARGVAATKGRGLNLRAISASGTARTFGKALNLTSIRARGAATTKGAALNLTAMFARGAAAAKGRGLSFTVILARGTAQSVGKGAASVGVALTALYGKGAAITKGRAAGLTMLSARGVAATKGAALNLRAISALGSAKTIGRAASTALTLTAISARGSAKTVGRAASIALALTAVYGRGATSTFGRPLASIGVATVSFARGIAATFGRAVITFKPATRRQQIPETGSSRVVSSGTGEARESFPQGDSREPFPPGQD